MLSIFIIQLDFKCLPFRSVGRKIEYKVGLIMLELWGTTKT